jgi:hypothetical protein
VLAERLRSGSQEDQPVGTALLELFGVPVMKAFSNKQSQRMFEAFREVKISNYQPGFLRLVDVISFLQTFEAGLSWIDEKTQRVWGFYQVIEATK